MAEKDLPNLRALENILISGVHVSIGDVVPKSMFTVKGDWQNLTISFNPPRMEETDAPVGKAGEEKPSKKSLVPGA